MPIISIDLARAYRLLNHGPTVLVSTTDGSVPNACAVAWCAPASRAPARFVLTLGRGHKTFENLVRVGECVINLPTVDIIDEVMICGRQSGHDGDKLGPNGIHVLPSKRVKPPRLSSCVAWIEAELVETWSPPKPPLVVVEALLAESRAGVLDEDGHFDVATFPTLHHLGGDRFVLPGEVVVAGEG